MATDTLPRATSQIPSLPIQSRALPLTAGTRGDTSDTYVGPVRYEIGVATLVSGETVINCWRIWMGGFEIVARYDRSDPVQVYLAAGWATRSRYRTCFWRDSGFPVRDADEVERVFPDLLPCN